MALVDLLSRLFALLALGVNLATVVALVALVRRDERLDALVRAHGVGAASAVTGVATLGSLYYSEVVGYPPCSLCWYQRIFMYSAATILLAALLRYAAVQVRGSSADAAGSDSPDPTVWRHVVPLALVGLPISLWHIAVERSPALAGAGMCAVDNPCSTIWVEMFGFVTLPYMAGTGFAFVLAVAALARSARRRTPVPDGGPVVASDSGRIPR